VVGPTYQARNLSESRRYLVEQKPRLPSASVKQTVQPGKTGRASPLTRLGKDYHELEDALKPNRANFSHSFSADTAVKFVKRIELRDSYKDFNGLLNGAYTT